MWGWGWGWWPFGGLGWLFGLFVIAALWRLVFWGRWGGRPWRWYRRGWGPYGPYDPYGYGPGPGAGYTDAEETLRQRLAKGEIDEAEYQRLLEVLRRR